MTSLYYLGTRFGGILKEPIKENLKNIKKQFERVKQKIFVENEVRIILGILDLIKIVMRFSKETNLEDDFLVMDNEQSLIQGQQKGGSQIDQYIEKNYLVALTRFKCLKYADSHLDQSNSFEQYQRSLVYASN